jgi:23S rRNA C2498 (ribose-2'-O)-methylase RlmM
MEGICKFCRRCTELTEHHIINKQFGGEDKYLIPNVCEKCHNELHAALQKNTRLLDRRQKPEETVKIGDQILISQAGSVFVGSPFSQNTQGRALYGMDFFNTLTRQKTHFEASISVDGSGTMVAVTGSPNAWIYYCFLID